MKTLLIGALAVVGGYSIWQWYEHRRHTLSRGFTATLQVGPLSASAGIGDYAVSPLASGVPTFNSDAIANGHGDQVAAAYHMNPQASMSGAVQYQPAFGPTVNQVSDTETPGHALVFGY